MKKIIEKSFKWFICLAVLFGIHQLPLLGQQEENTKVTITKEYIDEEGNTVTEQIVIEGEDAKSFDLEQYKNGSYQKLQNANSIVIGHLASVRKVHEAQAELLDRTGIEGLRVRFVESTVKLSDEVDSLIRKGRAAEHNIDELSKVIEQLKRTVRMASENMKNETEPPK